MIDIEFLTDLAREAGRAILEVYGTDFAVETKDDRSPLTLADRRAHDIISEGLRRRYPDIPIVSEEGEPVPFTVRRDWHRFWLVDPLDGTKEFIKRNGEFTVNIGLIENGEPIAGVIYVPVADLMCTANIGGKCLETTGGRTRRLTMPAPAGDRTARVLRSRSHPSAKVHSLLAGLSSYEFISRGSALKFCAMAAGIADVYPRLGPTWEWDTAAGHAIVRAAGGVVVDLDGNPLSYNKSELLNGPFLVAQSVEWLHRWELIHT